MQAQSADGVIHDFPDGTNISVVDSVMKDYAQNGAKAAPKQSATPDPQAAPAALTEYGPTATTPSEPKPSQAGADINSVAQGLVGGTGAVIAGAGRQTLAAAAQGTQRQLAVMDAIDKGETVPQDQDAIGYQFLSPEQRTKMRDAFTAASADLSKREPNAAMRAGGAIQDFAKDAFPVAPQNEGIQTGVGRMIGGVVPALAATAAGTAVGGPVGGVLAGAATIGSQTYDSTYQDAITKGATPEAAEDAAGKSAAVQALTMALPVGHLMRVPAGLREGLAKTLVNLGQNGVEFGTANAVGTFANNYVASQTYDPGRSLTQGTGDAALEGAIAGLIIPSVGGIARGRGDAPLPDVSAITKAPDINTAISEAAKVAQGAPGGLGAAATDAAPQPASRYGQAPAFVPPNTDPLPLPRILDLLNEDNRVAANRPDFVPPDTSQPAIPKSWGQVFAARPNGDTASAAPVPQSVGAAASRDMTAPEQSMISPQDMKANRYQAEMNELLAPPSGNDTMIHVSGSLPTLAEYSGDPVISQTENMLRQRNSAAFVGPVGEGKRLTDNNAARVTEYESQTPSRTALTMMRGDRDAGWQAATADLLPNAKPAELGPAADWVNDQLSDPTIHENDAVRGILEDFQQRLYDADGNLKTDPAAVWGIHNQLQNQLAKAKDPLNATGAEKYAFSELMTAKKYVDGAMNVSTDNRFQDALDNYAKASQAINAGQELEDFRPKLTNAQGEIMGPRFHAFVVDLAKLRGDPGIDPAMSISDDTMRSLINIDTDLKRAGLIKLGGAAGSPTNLLGALAESTGIKAAHSALGVIPGVGPVIKAGADYMAQRRLDALTAKHLAPPTGGYAYPRADSP